MITAAVQQASQIVEVQGAPATGQGEGEDFRATFSANVKTPSTQHADQSQTNQESGVPATSGSNSTAKQALTSSLFLKSASSTSKHQSLLQLTDSAKNEEALPQEVESTSHLSSDFDSETALRNTVADASVPKNDLRFAVRTPVGDEGLEETSVAATAAALTPAAVAGSTVALQEGNLSKSVNSADAKDRKTEGLDPKKDLSFARAEVIDPGTPAVAIPDQAQLHANLPEVLTGTLASSEIQVAILQSPTLETASTKATGAITATTQRSDLGSKRAQELTKASQGAGGASTATATSFARAESILPAASDAFASSQTTATDAKSGSGFNIPEAKAVVPAPEPTEAASLQKKDARVAYSGPAVTAFHPAHALALNTTGIVQESSSTSQDADPARGLLTSVGLSPSGILPSPVDAGANAVLQVGIARGAAPTASLRGGSAKVEGAAAKDEKTKASLGGAEDTVAPAVSPTTSPTTSTSWIGTPDTSSVPGNVSTTAGIAAGKAVTAADVAVPVLSNTLHAAGTSAHAGAGDQASVAARVQGEASAAQTVEAASSHAQLGDSHRTLLATPTTLEVGVQSGTQGWLRIRAEVGNQGGVNASLTANSTGGRELLHSQAPALNAFLHSEQMAVTTTVVDRGTFAGGGQTGTLGSGGPGSQDGSGASNNSFFHGGGLQGGGPQGDDTQRQSSQHASDPVRSYNPLSGVSEAEGARSGRISASVESGRWLNVRV